MHDKFNADFYVAAATVIPVLYLALTLQGQTLDRIVSGMLANRHKAGGTFAFFTWNMAGNLIVICGAAGEFLAIWSLYNRSSLVGGSVAALWFLMVIAAMIAPIVTFADRTNEYRAQRALIRKRLTAERSADEQPPDATE